MPPVVTAIADFLVAEGFNAAVATFIATVVVDVAVTVAISAAARLLATKPSSNNAGAGMNGRTLTVRNPVAPRQIIYGQVRAGGILVYAGTSGVDQDILHLVIAHAGHECDSMSTLWLNDEAAPLDGSGNATGKYAGYVMCKDHLGPAGQTVDTDLNAAMGAEWPTTSILAGITYSYVRLIHNPDLFPSGLPNVSRLIKGKKVLDTRSSTTAWSNNWALCVNDYATDNVLGLGATSAEMNTAATNTAANVSDEAINLLVGGTEPRYTINGLVDTSVTPASVLADMLAAGAGVMPYVGGQFFIKAGAHTSSVQPFTLDDARGAITLNTGDPMRDSFNSVRGTFISELNDWQPADVVPYADSGFISEDNGVRSWKDIVLPFTTSAATARRLFKAELLRSRSDISFIFPCKLTAMNIRAGDVIDLTIPLYGWTNKLFEVVEFLYVVDTQGEAPVLGIEMALRSTLASVWTWNYLTDDPGASSSLVPTLYDPNDLNTLTPTTPSLSNANFPQPDGTISPRIQIDWTAPSDGQVLRGGFVEIEYKKTADTLWIIWADARGDATQDFLTDVLLGVSYDVRYRFVNVRGVYSQYSAVANFAASTTAIATPSLSPPAQLFTTTITVLATCADGAATIRYTTDGTPVSPSSTAFPGGGLTFTSTTVLRVRAYDGNDTSGEVSQTYTIDSTASVTATPSISFSPHSAATSSPTSTCTLTCATSGATIHYRINGGSWTTYSSGFTVNDGDTVEAYASHSGLTDSGIAYDSYASNV